LFPFSKESRFGNGGAIMVDMDERDVRECERKEVPVEVELK
jgi:hypothetical protein